MLQWEWLGGLPPIRRVGDHRRRHVGHEPRGLLARAGFEVELGCRTHEQARATQRAARERALPARRRAARLDPGAARRRARARRATTSSASRCRPGRCRRCSPPTASRSRAGPACSSLSKGLVPPLGTLPVGVRLRALRRARGRRARRARRTPPRRSSTAPRSCSPRSTAAFARQLADALARGQARRHDHAPTSPASSSPAAPRTPPCSRPPRPSSAGPNVAGAAAGKVFAEVDALARAARRPAGDVRRPGRRRRPRRDRGRRRARATAAPASCSRRACRRRRSAPVLGHAAEAVDSVPLLADGGARTRSSRRRRSTAWRRWSRAGSSPSSGRRR